MASAPCQTYFLMVSESVITMVLLVFVVWGCVRLSIERVCVNSANVIIAIASATNGFCSFCFCSGFGVESIATRNEKKAITTPNIPDRDLVKMSTLMYISEMPAITIFFLSFASRVKLHAIGLIPAIHDASQFGCPNVENTRVWKSWLQHLWSNVRMWTNGFVPLPVITRQVRLVPKCSIIAIIETIVPEAIVMSIAFLIVFLSMSVTDVQ